jgi:N-acetylated-alpha-linked acidic dipeptidase
VEEISLSSSEGLKVDFSPLRQSIGELKVASIHLDKEKEKAGNELKRLLKKWKRKHSIHKKLKKAWCRLRKALGKKCHGHKHEQQEHNDHEPMQLGRGDQTVEIKPRIGRLPEWVKEQAEREDEKERQDDSHRGHRLPSRKFVRAVKRVQAVNKKLSTFERGFISEGGIKDREWYRHLGVAPGKWLGECCGVLVLLLLTMIYIAGYGATTFPAITEAITIEHNATLVQYETARLKDLIDGIANSLHD